MNLWALFDLTLQCKSYYLENLVNDVNKFYLLDLQVFHTYPIGVARSMFKKYACTVFAFRRKLGVSNASK